MKKPDTGFVRLIRQHPAVILLLAATAIGAFMRLTQLTTQGFWVDEFLHVFSARSIVENGQPLLPSGTPYTRASIYTYTVAFFFKFLGINEVSARLPSVIFGILAIIVTYGVLARFTNRSTGIISAFLVALSPYCITWSRQCRMYALFQLAYFIGIAVLFHFYERVTWPRKNRGILGITLCVASAAMIALICSIHDFGAFIIPTFAAYALVMFCITAFSNGAKTAFTSKYFKILPLMLLAMGVVLFYHLAEGAVQQGRAAPLADMNNTTGFYRWLLSNTHPVFFYFYPLSLLIAIIRWRRFGVYLGCCFLIPFIVLSYIISWKSIRYFYFAFPFFLITSAVAIEYLLHTGWALGRRIAAAAASRRNFFRKPPVFYTLLCALQIAVLYPVTFPWIRLDRKIFYDFPVIDFGPIARTLSAEAKGDIIITSEPFFVEYYTGRKPDFILPVRHDPHEARPFARNDAGRLLDPIGGIPILENLEELRAVEQGGKKVWLVTKDFFLQPSLLDTGMIEHIKNTYRKQPLQNEGYDLYYAQT